MQRGRDDVIRLFTGKLDDVFAQIGFDRLDAGCSSRSLRWISSVVIDFDFTTSFTPRSGPDSG